MIISLRRKYMTVNYALPSSATTTTVCLVLSGYITAASLYKICPLFKTVFTDLFTCLPPLPFRGLLHILCSMKANDQSIQYDQF